MAAQLSLGYLDAESVLGLDIYVFDIPFNSQNLEMLAERSLEPCVPNIAGLPIRRSNGRTNEVVPIG